MFKPQYELHPQYILNRHRWEAQRIYNRGQIRAYCHKVGLVPPIGHFQPEIAQSRTIRDAMQYLRGRVAIGSGWSDRALLYAAEGHDSKLVTYTLNGFAALLSEQAPVIELPQRINYLQDKCTAGGKSLREFYVDTCMEVLLTGRSPIVIDIQDGAFALVSIRPEALLDWGAAGGAEQSLSYAIVEDWEPNPEYDPVHPGEPRYIRVESYHRVVDGVYTVTKYRSKDGDYLPTEEIVPKYMGRAIDFVPIMVIGSVDNSPDVDTIPLEAIGQCQFGVYSETCRLAHAERNSLEPFIHISGVDADEAPAFLGAGTVVSTIDPASRVQYVQPDVGAFSHAQERIADYYAYAQEQGASLLGARRGTSESGEALRLRHMAATASLKSVVENVGDGITKLLRNVAIWAGSDPDAVEFTPSREFSTSALPASDISALVSAWQSGGISHSTLLTNFRRGGLLQSGESAADELERLTQPGEKYSSTTDTET